MEKSRRDGLLGSKARILTAVSLIMGIPAAAIVGAVLFAEDKISQFTRNQV